MTGYRRPKSRRGRGGAARCGEAGFALPYVLWAVALLSLLAVGVTGRQADRAAAVAAHAARARTAALAEAGLALAALSLADARPERRWWPDARPNRIAHGGETMTVTVQDEAGRIDLNAGNQGLLARLLQHAGMPADAAAATLQRLDAGLRGEAIDQECRGTRPVLCPRQGALLHPREIALVVGDDWAARLMPDLTVHSGYASVSALTAVPEVRAALALPEPSAMQPPPPQPGQAYTVTLGLGKDGNVQRRRAVIRYTGAPPTGYWTLAVSKEREDE